MAPARLLLVDDDESVLSGLKLVLEANEFDVTTAASVSAALRCIVDGTFDVLLTDLHMPGAGDGLAVVSAMRHAHPHAITMLLSAFPDMAKATAALLSQIDEVLMKPVKASAVVDLVRQRLAEEKPARHVRSVEPVATVLERERDAIVQQWLAQMDAAGDSARTGLTVEERCEHLPDALQDVLFRLRNPLALGSTALFSITALQHGTRRKRQGLSAATLVEEARALQIALFRTIDANIRNIDLGQLADALMTIADEVNAQLLQSVAGFENEQPVDVPVWARWDRM